MDTSRCDVSETRGKNIFCSASKSYYPNAVFCCTDISLGTDKWEIAPDLGWSRSYISGCTGSQCCFTAFSAETKFPSPPPLPPRDKSLRVFAFTPPRPFPPAPPRRGGFLHHPIARVKSDRPRWAGTEHPPGSVGAAAGAHVPKNEQSQPWSCTPPQQQPSGWPWDCGCCGQLPLSSRQPPGVPLPLIKPLSLPGLGL